MSIILITIYVMCTGIYIFMGISGFLKDTKSRTNKTFFILCLILSFWAFITAYMMGAATAEKAAFYRNLSVIFWCALYCLSLYFILLLTGKEKFLNKKIKALIFIPGIISIILYAANPFTAADMVKLHYGWGFAVPKWGQCIFLWKDFFNLYYLTYIAADFILIMDWWKNTKYKREKKQAKIIIFYFSTTALVGIMFDFLAPVTKIAFMPPIAIFLVLLAMSGVWYSMMRYKFNTVTEENAVLDVFKIMNEGLIILNHEGVVQDANKYAESLLKYKENELVGKHICSILANKAEGLVQDEFSSLELEMVSKNNESINVLASFSNLKDEFGEKFGDRLGAVLIFQDIFQIKQLQYKLAAARDNLEIKVQQSTYELASANIKLENFASSDQLTGLPNRRIFTERLNEAIKNAEMKDNMLAVLFLDLDGFKFINDALGYDHGDELLKKVSKRIKSILKNDDVVARVGGDEFSILLNNLTCKEHITNICNEIISAFKSPFDINKAEIFVTTSMGVAVYPYDGTAARTLLKNAAIAMYNAKENGKGIFELCNSRMKSSLDEVMKLTNDMYRAIEFNELELYYQPQVNIKSGEIEGVEALLRWHHPKLGTIRPDLFIPIAERTGLIISMGEWVLRTACIQMMKWKKLGLPKLSMAVNISVNQIRNRKFIKQIEDILQETGMEPEDIELEITETVLVKDQEHIIDILKELKTMKVRIAIDDFGIEYSSLSYLKQMPVDRIKIAKPFIDGIDKNTGDESIISAIIIMGRQLGLNLIAEGVETERQLQFLKSQNCDEIQGYYYYKPMPAGEIEKLFMV